MHETVSCTILRTPEEMYHLRPQWETLWRKDRLATPFQSPAWLIPWWHQFGEGALRIAVLAINGCLRALLPLYIYTERGDGYRKLFPLGVATSDYLDGIFAPECTPEEIVFALNHLSAEGEWDAFEMNQLRPDSLLSRAFTLWIPDHLEDGSGERTSQLDAVPLAGLHSKIRRNFRYYTGRAACLGELHLTIADADSWPEALEVLERLHTARWNQTGERGVLVDRRVRAWHREAFPQLLSEGIARIYCLRLNGEIIAALYALIDPPDRQSRTQYLYITAFSPEHAELCPGSIMLALVIDHAAQEGFTTLDMLRGTEPYKELWHPRWCETHRFRCQHGSGSPDLTG